MLAGRGGELLAEAAACQEERCPLGRRAGRARQEDGRGEEASEGTGTKVSC